MRTTDKETPSNPFAVTNAEQRQLTNKPTDVVLGVYGTEDWIVSDWLRRRYLSGTRTIEIEDTWIVPAHFSLAAWVKTLDVGTFIFTGANRAVVSCGEDGIIFVNHTRDKLRVTLNGDPVWSTSWKQKLDAVFYRAENLIEWVYNARGDTVSVALNHRPVIKSAYPWLKSSVDDYIREYLDSDANVLILIGPPGTGKTTFIKNMIHLAKANAKVAYDSRILEGDDFFAGFIDDDSRFLIMEDADTFLDSRHDGNSIMHKFLNVSDGLISAADKKLVFSTNLPNTHSIDEALLREGRCFDVLEFRPLTRAEAQAVRDEIGSDLAIPDKDHITLAELFSSQPSTKKKRQVGFI